MTLFRMPFFPNTIVALGCILASSFFASQAARAQSCAATVNDVDFGQPNVLATDPTDALASVTVSCTRIPFLSIVKICPNLGDGSGGSISSIRQMRSGASNTLNYQLYQDASRTQGWGAVDEPQLGTVPAILLSGGFSGSANSTVALYGRMFGSQPTSPGGSYSSTFAGSDSAFAYTTYFLGATTNCTGFSGTSTIHSSFDVLAVVSAYCTLSTADLDFGAAGILQAPIKAQANLRVACTNKAPFLLALDGGLAHAQPASRKMTSAAGDSITYGLYRDSARTQVWGDTSTTWVSGTGSGFDQSFAVYGLVPIQATPRPGSFSDRIVVTVTY